MNLSRLMFFRSIQICALITLTLAQSLSATEVHAQVTHTVIAASGDAAPAGGNYTTLPDAPALNVRGQMAFDAVLGGPSTRGVFLSDGVTISPIALSGNLDPAAANFGFVSTPFLTTRGDVIFTTDTGFFFGDGKHTVPLVQNGDPAPGGGSLILGPYAANSRGLIAFQSFVTGGVSSEGIFRNDGTHTVAIALEGTSSPTGGTFLFFGSPVIDDGDQVAFFAGMTGGSADFGLYRGDGENITTIFAANQAAPGGGTFVDFSDPVLNKHGQVLAVAQLENGAGPSGIFLHDGKDAVAIALSGLAAPKGGSYSSFFGPQILNDHGQVAFAPFLTGGTSRRGIFRGDGIKTTTIALEGTAAAGTTGTFASFGDMKMGNDGTVAFIATLTFGVGGVDLTNNIGIWVGTSETDLHLVARTGEIIGGKTLTRPLSLGQLEIKGRPIVWLGRFSGNSTAIVSSDLHAE
jgi:hypothetical protein